MKKVLLLLLILPLFFACKDDASSSSEPETKPKPIVPAMCGDFHLDVDIGEECDDGNLDNGDGCSSTCKREQPARCGDGYLDEGEDITTCPDDASYCGDGVCYTDNETEENCPCDCRVP